MAAMGKRKGVDAREVLRMGPAQWNAQIDALPADDRALYVAYLRFAHREAERGGTLAACWPRDAEVAAFIGRSPEHVAGGRARLARRAAPFIAQRIVSPGGALPDGSRDFHKRRVVVMLLELGSSEEAALALELVDAATTVAVLEPGVVAAKARLEALREAVDRLREQGAANDDGAVPALAATPGPKKAPLHAAELEGEARAS